jgi:hypothetical protein
MNKLLGALGGFMDSGKEIDRVKDRVSGLGCVDPDKYVFFPVSITKLVLMSIFTLGLYDIYWFYKNWQVIKEREDRDLMPVWRALFTIFFCYQCFGRIEDGAKAQGITSALPAGFLAAIFILVVLTGNLPDPYWLISLLTVLPIISAQITANRVNAAVTPSHNINATYSGWNIAAIIFGGLFLMLIIIGFFLVSDVPST